jgi:hypothetical protein
VIGFLVAIVPGAFVALFLLLLFVLLVAVMAPLSSARVITVTATAAIMPPSFVFNMAIPISGMGSSLFVMSSPMVAALSFYSLSFVTVTAPTVMTISATILLAL